jgi:hypothetical protein
MGGAIIVRYGMVDCSWWDKFLFAFCISFIITVIKRLRMNESKKEYKENKFRDRIMNYIQNNSNSSSISNNKKCINKNKDNKDEDNKFWINKLMNNLVKISLNIILVLVIYFLVGIEFGFFNSIYCQPMDGESNNNIDSNKDNKDLKDKDNSYNISANVGKGVIKDAVQGAIECISTVVPGVIGGMVGGSIAVAVVNASKSLPPIQKAAVGVGTAILGTFGVGVAAGVSREAVKIVSTPSSKAAESPVNVSTVSNNTAGTGDSGKDGFIASVLETGDELSPLQMILNYEIILGILILAHMCILVLIPLHKLYVSSVSNLISKFLSPNIVKKYEKFKEKIEIIGNSYLIILVIINILFILFYVCVIIYANVQLSNNIEEFINVHLNMQKSLIMLLFVKSKFIVNKNKIEKNKYFNA